MDYCLKLKNILIENNFNKFLIEVFQLLDTNELASLGELDTFPDDYLLGVYLPLLVPILFPIAQAFILELKQIIQKKKLI